MSQIARHCCCISLLFLPGCMGAYNLFAGGGRLIDPSKEQYKVIAEYQSNSTSNILYQLIEIENRLAILEISVSENSYALLETHWSDARGDHFGVWVKGQGEYAIAMEIVIPHDRQEPALKYVYPHGQYHILEVDGVLRPVPIKRGQTKPIVLTPS